MRALRTTTALTLALTLLLAACGDDADDAATGTDTDAVEDTDEADEATEDDADDEAVGDESTDPSDLAELAAASGVDSIGFIGFWATNSFTLAVLDGVEEAAAEAGIEVADLSPSAYDAAAQTAAIQDATVAGEHEMIIILAADSIGIVSAVEDATDAGITVVASFVNFGDDFDSLEPVTDGVVVVAETPTDNGRTLADLAIMACEDIDPCNVAYLEGLAALPLDNARTDAFTDQLATAPNTELVAQVEGGYTPDEGRSAAQDVMQANPDVDVMVGSTQAIVGAQDVVETSEVALIGNGSSIEAHEAVLAGEWFAHYNLDIPGMGVVSVENGLGAAAGDDVEPLDVSTLRDPLGTADVIADNEPAYSDLG
jgi:ribose transport system substrate-binding protein